MVNQISGEGYLSRAFAFERGTSLISDGGYLPAPNVSHEAFRARQCCHRLPLLPLFHFKLTTYNLQPPSVPASPPSETANCKLPTVNCLFTPGSRCEGPLLSARLPPAMT